MGIETVMVVLGGNPVRRDRMKDVLAGDYVIAADSGLDLAMALGIPVDIVVGDLDSATSHAVDTARAAGVEFSEHPVDKDQTDLELALDIARLHSPDRVVIVGGGGGRFDHLLGNAALIGTTDLGEVIWIIDEATVHVVRGQAAIHGSVGGLVSLLPVGSEATGVRTRGLEWELDGETLSASHSRGLSNRFREPTAHVEVGSGALLVIIT